MVKIISDSTCDLSQEVLERYDLTAEQMGDWANAMGIEAVYIDKDTKIRDFKRDLQIGELFYR